MYIHSTPCFHHRVTDLDETPQPLPTSACPSGSDENRAADGVHGLRGHDAHGTGQATGHQLRGQRHGGRYRVVEPLFGQRGKEEAQPQEDAPGSAEDPNRICRDGSLGTCFWMEPWHMRRLKLRCWSDPVGRSRGVCHLSFSVCHLCTGCLST